MDKIKKLVHYISKYGNCTKQFAARFLLTIFEKNNFFVLPDEKQEIIIDNLISYFDTIIITFDRVGVINNKQNKNISKHEIFAHVERKVNCLVNIKDKFRFY